MYNPLELQKLCSNCIVEDIYDNNYNIFLKKLYALELPDDINKIVIERYELIKHIIKSSKY